MLGWARSILIAHEALEADLALMRGNLVGTLRLGVVPSAIALVPELVDRSSGEHPLVDVDVHADMSAQQI